MCELRAPLLLCYNSCCSNAAAATTTTPTVALTPSDAAAVSDNNRTNFKSCADIFSFHPPRRLRDAVHSCGVQLACHLVIGRFQRSVQRMSEAGKRMG
jgi:hypothetical protein